MSQLQAIIFKKDDWNIRNIHKFLERNMLYPIKPIHTTRNFYRVRLQFPNKKYKYRMITIQVYPEIKGVVMWK